MLLKGPPETPKGVRLEMRQRGHPRSWTVFANVRLYPSTRSWASTGPVFREEYGGQVRSWQPGRECPYRRASISWSPQTPVPRRIPRPPFELARPNGKTNVAQRHQGQYHETAPTGAECSYSASAMRLPADYPEITSRGTGTFDIMTANLVKPVKSAAGFKVFVLPNLYGYLITDEAAQITVARRQRGRAPSLAV